VATSRQSLLLHWSGPYAAAHSWRETRRGTRTADRCGYNRCEASRQRMGH
jgi:hypothetical protein